MEGFTLAAVNRDRFRGDPFNPVLYVHLVSTICCHAKLLLRAHLSRTSWNAGQILPSNQPFTSLRCCWQDQFHPEAARL